MQNVVTEGAAASEATWTWLLLGEWLIALGILAVAGGLLWTVLQNRRILRAERSPNVIVANLVFAGRAPDGTAHTLRYEVVNLGRFPTYLRTLTYHTDTMHSGDSQAVRVLIPPSESRSVEHTFEHLTLVEYGALALEFQYGATGTHMHKLELPLSLNAQKELVVDPHPDERALTPGRQG